MGKERLDKILSSQNVATRSETKQLVRKGQITVNGVTVKKSDEKFDPVIDIISVCGKKLCFRRYIYIMLNKPRGVLSASRDKNTPTVIDLLPPELKRDGLFPAGRLDKDTQGFVLITDDGALAHKMLSPKSHVYKLYEAQCDRPLSDTDIRAFAAGITVGDVHYMPAQMKLTAPDTALVEICEGKFHQIRKMFASVGAEVIRLKRLRIGEVYLDKNLAEGECRELTENEKKDILSLKHGI